jgi:hypothetical protein
MNWSAAIANLFRAVAAYFELKNRSFYYDILIKSKQQQKELISEIEKLRASRNLDDARAADVVRMQLLQEQRFSKHLSATYAATDAVSGR